VSPFATMANLKTAEALGLTVSPVAGLVGGGVVSGVIGSMGCGAWRARSALRGFGTGTMRCSPETTVGHLHDPRLRVGRGGARLLLARPAPLPSPPPSRSDDRQAPRLFREPQDRRGARAHRVGPVAGLVGIEGGVVASASTESDGAAFRLAVRPASVPLAACGDAGAVTVRALAFLFVNGLTEQAPDVL
jgi:hypothetical protein